MRSIVIAGGGHAGGVAAASLRATGIGDRITLIGEEEWPPYERPPLSKSLLAGSTTVEKAFLRPAPAYDDIGVELRTGIRAVSICRETQSLKLSDDTSIPYHDLIIATGARARRLDEICPVKAQIYYVRTLQDVVKLRSRLVAGSHVGVVGAGLIGLEVAATTRRMNCNVTVLEAADRVLSRVIPANLSQRFSDLHCSNGVTIRTGIRIKGVTSSGAETIVETEDGIRLGFDVLVAGIGSVPNVELAQSAGLAASDGILTDEYGRTNDPHIYAIGDVTRHFNKYIGQHVRLESWQNAQDQARAISNIIAGGAEPYATIPWFWTDQYDQNFQFAGFGTSYERLVWRGSADDASTSVFYLQGDKVVGGACINNSRDLRHMRKLIAGANAVNIDALADLQVPLSKLT